MKSIFEFLAAALAALSLPVLAASVQITITGADGKPAADTVVLVQPAASWAAQPLPEPTVITQRDIRFQPYVTVVPVGAAVRFINRDGFAHHVRSQPGGPLGSVPPAKQFEFRLAAARGNNAPASAEITLDIPGSIVLGCHLHNSMRGHVFVANTPWAAVTDDNGRVALLGVPEGQAEVRVWHPDQLVDQPAVRLQVSPQANAEARLNFTPRKRPPPVFRNEY